MTRRGNGASDLLELPIGVDVVRAATYEGVIRVRRAGVWEFFENTDREMIG